MGISGGVATGCGQAGVEGVSEGFVRMAWFNQGPSRIVNVGDWLLRAAIRFEPSHLTKIFLSRKCAVKHHYFSILIWPLRGLKAILVIMLLPLFLSSCADKESSESFNIDDEPWYVAEFTNRLNSLGKPMVTCRRPEYEPLEYIKRVESVGLTYSVDTGRNNDDGTPLVISITVNFQEGPSKVTYYRSKPGCQYMAQLSGREVFDEGEYR